MICSQFLRSVNFNSTFIKRSKHSGYQEKSGLVVTAPKFPDIVKGANVNLLKQEGDYVSAYEPVLEIETDKTIVAITAPKHGIIEKFLINHGHFIHSEQSLFQLRPILQYKEAIIDSDLLKSKLEVLREEISFKRGLINQESREEGTVGVTNIQQKYAQMLKNSQNRNVLLTSFNEIDMSSIIQFQELKQKQFEKEYGVKLTFMGPILKAAVYALAKQPIINAFIKDNKIIYRDYVDIKISIATKHGLFSQVIKDMSNMSFPDIELAIQNLVQKVNGKPEHDFDNGTFAVDNGSVGSLINLPIMTSTQSAILGLNSTIYRPVAEKGKAVIKPMMYVCLTYDHRLVDGKEAVLFLRTVKFAVEDPRVILAGI